jgi:hypothetical protein
MLVCEAPELVRWQPDFSSSGQGSPRWTRLVCEGLEICNTMEGSHWTEPELVQVVVCEECGHPGCASGGYARLSRLASYALLSRPLPHPADPWEVSEYRPSHAIGKHGAVAVPLAEWTRWGERFDNLPHPDVLPPSQRSHLAAAWGLERIFAPRDKGAPPARVVRDRLIAAALRSTEEASAHLLALVDWFGADAELPVGSDLARAKEIGAQIETLYFDLPDTFDRPMPLEWQAFALTADGLTPAFAATWVLVPEPVTA